MASEAVPAAIDEGVIGSAIGMHTMLFRHFVGTPLQNGALGNLFPPGRPAAGFGKPRLIRKQFAGCTSGLPVTRTVRQSRSDCIADGKTRHSTPTLWALPRVISQHQQKTMTSELSATIAVRTERHERMDRCTPFELGFNRERALQDLQPLIHAD